MKEIKTIKSTNENHIGPHFYPSQKCILVVEDDRSHRTLMDRILKDCGFQTVQAENGLIALSKLETNQKFDLIIMDWDMPELNGLDTTKAIRAKEVYQNSSPIPIIAFTGNRDPGDREKCIAAGMDAYLPKDVWMPKWRETLINNLQGLIAGNFELEDLQSEQPCHDNPQNNFDLDAFDAKTFEQTALLLKDEINIAIDEYLEDAAAYIKDIKNGLENNDAVKAERGSHPLKSNSKGFGLLAISQIAETINNFAKNKDLSAVELIFPELQKAFCKAEKKLREITKNI